MPMEYPHNKHNWYVCHLCRDLNYDAFVSMGILPERPGTLDFDGLREATVKRTEEVFHPLKSWSPSDWAMAAAGELGEACNLLKKMRRGGEYPRYPDFGTGMVNNIPLRRVGEELADTIIYIDLLAARLEINLADEIRAKFNLVSREKKSEQYL